MQADAETVPDIRTAARLMFGSGGNAGAFTKQGWATPEEGRTWCLGPRAELLLKVRPGEGDLLLELQLHPFMHPPFLVRQKLEVRVLGTSIGEAVIQRDNAVAFRAPRSLIGDRTDLPVTLLCPDAMRPSDLHVNTDTRLLAFELQELMAFWVPPEAPLYPRSLPALPFRRGEPPERMEMATKALTGLGLADLMMQFESLGHNCEFGLVQRVCGAEPLGLLRFVGISIRELLIGLDFGFEGVDDPDLIRVYIETSPENKPEWMMRNDRYDIHAHTFRDPASVTGQQMKADEVKKLAFQRRRFLEVLETGQKIFVWQRQEAMAEAHVLPILNLLRSHGRNALLFVNQGGDAPSGSVDRLAEDLYRGNIDRLAPIGAADKFNREAWISICANAYRLWRECGYGG